MKILLMIMMAEFESILAKMKSIQNLKRHPAVDGNRTGHRQLAHSHL